MRNNNEIMSVFLKKIMIKYKNQDTVESTVPFPVILVHVRWQGVVSREPTSVIMVHVR